MLNESKPPPAHADVDMRQMVEEAIAVVEQKAGIKSPPPQGGAATAMNKVYKLNGKTVLDMSAWPLPNNGRATAKLRKVFDHGNGERELTEEEFKSGLSAAADFMLSEASLKQRPSAETESVKMELTGWAAFAGILSPERIAKLGAKGKAYVGNVARMLARDPKSVLPGLVNAGPSALELAKTNAQELADVLTRLAAVEEKQAKLEATQATQAKAIAKASKGASQANKRISEEEKARKEAVAKETAERTTEIDAIRAQLTAAELRARRKSAELEAARAETEVLTGRLAAISDDVARANSNSDEAVASSKLAAGKAASAEANSHAAVATSKRAEALSKRADELSVSAEAKATGAREDAELSAQAAGNAAAAARGAANGVAAAVVHTTAKALAPLQRKVAEQAENIKNERAKHTALEATVGQQGCTLSEMQHLQMTQGVVQQRLCDALGQTQQVQASQGVQIQSQQTAIGGMMGSLSAMRANGAATGIGLAAETALRQASVQQLKAGQEQLAEQIKTLEQDEVLTSKAATSLLSNEVGCADEISSDSEYEDANDLDWDGETSQPGA